MHLTFEAQRRQITAKEPLTFECPPGSGQVFEAIWDPPGGILLDFANAARGTVADQLETFGRFFDCVLTPDSASRFEAAFRSPDPAVNITLPEANAVMERLLEVYSGVPTMPASTSRRSGAGTGPKSTGKRRHKA